MKQMTLKNNYSIVKLKTPCEPFHSFTDSKLLSNYIYITNKPMLNGMSFKLEIILSLDKK